MNGALSGLVTGSLAKVLASLCVTYGPGTRGPGQSTKADPIPRKSRDPGGWVEVNTVSEEEDLGQEPEETRDRRFAPVTRGSDARGHTSKEEEAARQEAEVSGTEVSGIDVGQPDALPPDEERVRRAEEQDDSR